MGFFLETHNGECDFERHFCVIPLWIKFYMSRYFTIIRHHSSSFVIFRDINLNRFSRRFCESSWFFHENPWKTVRINITIFREYSWTMVVIICQFPSSLTEIRESLRFNSLGYAWLIQKLFGHRQKSELRTQEEEIKRRGTLLIICEKIPNPG